VQTNADTIPQDGYCAVASCGATLETSPSTESASPYLQKLLPEYSSRDISVDAVASSYTLSNVAADIPLSDGEIHQAWTHLCAFEEREKAFRPTASILLSFWKAILAATIAEDIYKGSSFHIGDLWTLVADEEFPLGMFHAIMHRVAEPEVMVINSTLKSARHVQVFGVFDNN
jgi:sister chromatid cohesion protein DCC1